MTLTYRKRVRRGIDHVDDGLLYVHHFGTGWQELVFSTHAAAKLFAVSVGAAFKGVD